MFKSKLNKQKLNKYIEFLNDLIVDKEIKEEIGNNINYFYNNGKLYIDDENLYGTFVNYRDLNRANPVKEFIEIKIDGNNLICNYSEWSHKKIVNIIQRSLKGGNKKINKKEINNIFTYNNNNESAVEEIEKIYSYYDDLVYESKLKYNSDFDTFIGFNDTIIYDDSSYFSNRFELEKNWYIPNGSRIKYILKKSFMNEDDKIFEQYSICPKVQTNDLGNFYNFIELDSDLFKKFMTGEITIDKVIEKTKEDIKKLVKENK